MRLPDSITIDQLAAFHDRVAKEFPSKENQATWEAEIQFSPGASTAATRPVARTEGYRFISADALRVIQVRLDGFAFSRLRPYTHWEEFRDEARNLWQEYVAIAKPLAVTRTALRYVNMIDIPLPLRDFKEFILTTPEIAPGLPQGIASYFMRLVLPRPEINAVAVVTEALNQGTERKSTIPLIFDIDVFREAEFDASSDAIWKELEGLRDVKNEIFFNSITDRGKELFK